MEEIDDANVRRSRTNNVRNVFKTLSLARCKNIAHVLGDSTMFLSKDDVISLITDQERKMTTEDFTSMLSIAGEVELASSIYSSTWDYSAEETSIEQEPGFRCTASISEALCIGVYNFFDWYDPGFRVSRQIVAENRICPEERVYE